MGFPDRVHYGAVHMHPNWLYSGSPRGITQPETRLEEQVLYLGGEGSPGSQVGTLSTVGTWGLIAWENSGSQARAHTTVLPQPAREEAEVSVRPRLSGIGKNRSRVECASSSSLTHPHAHP